MRHVQLNNLRNGSSSLGLNVQSSVVNYSELSEYRALMFFVDYFTYITSVPGIFTNALTIFVALKIHPRSTSELHMLLLGCTDFQVVSVRLAIHILRMLKYNWTDVSCKILMYASNVGYFFSNWILVSWTIERFVAVVYPLKKITWCTSKKVKTALTVTLFICCLILVPQFLETYSSYSSSKSKYLCEFSALYYKRYAIFENFVYLYIPIVIVVGCNCAIAVRLRQTTILRATFTLNKNDLQKRAREQKQMTYVLIVVASSFFLLHLPQFFAKLWQVFYPDAFIIQENNIRDYLRFSLFIVTGYQFTDFQNSINFFLYCIFASKVKQVLKKQFCCRYLKTRYLC